MEIKTDYLEDVPGHKNTLVAKIRLDIMQKNYEQAMSGLIAALLERNETASELADDVDHAVETLRKLLQNVRAVEREEKRWRTS